MDRKLLLQSPSEQSRLLHEVPEVIADVVEAELTFEDSPRKDKLGCLPELAPGTSELPSTDFKGNGTSCCPNGGKDPAALVTPVKGDQPILVEERQQSEGTLSKKSSEKNHIFAPDVKDGDILQREQHQSVLEVKQHHSKALLPEELPRESDFVSQKNYFSAISGGKKNQSVDFGQMQEKKRHTLIADFIKERHQTVLEVKQHCSKSPLLEELPQKSHTFALEGQCNVVSQKTSHEQTNEKKPKMSTANLIELSDDDEQDLNHAPIKQAAENNECSKWYCVGPHGEKRGPLSMSLLKRWSDTSSYALHFKVWRTDQSQQDAISLSDALCHNFPQNRRES
uniref:GYF domain-containing protein n=1 Tax=Fagus sylvatica TaxID=28930 RepID=A0A2N9IJ11_FAGSY